MREIKFRGKDKEKDIWRYGDLIYDPDLDISHIHCFEYYGSDSGLQRDENIDPVVSSTVGQHTGIKDDCGTEIYEGDIIEVFDDDRNMDCYSVGTGEVKFCRGEWCIYDGSNNSLYDICDAHIVEVIGNIHDNPELMKEA